LFTRTDIVATVRFSADAAVRTRMGRTWGRCRAKT